MEFENKYSHKSAEVKSKNKDVTVGHVPEALEAIFFPLHKAWKVYEIQAKITGESRRAPEGTWVLGGGIEMPVSIPLLDQKFIKKTVEKN